MLVISFTECPPALRGDISHWLLEVDTGVFVGTVSQRVREALWQRVTQHLKNGRAIMVYTARNEQRMDFRVHNAAWEPIDFDGLKLMLRPSATRQRARQEAKEPLKPGYSNAARNRMAKHTNQRQVRTTQLPERYCIIDLETTGFNPKKHHIIELGAIKWHQGQEVGRFQALIRQAEPLPQQVRDLTGLSQQVLNQHGQELADLLPAFIQFLEDLPIIAHNIAFDVDFLVVACDSVGLSFPGNPRIDTLALARRHVPDAPDHKLTTLMQHLALPHPRPHRSLEDCAATTLLLDKLIEIRQSVT